MRLGYTYNMITRIQLTQAYSENVNHCQVTQTVTHASII